MRRKSRCAQPPPRRPPRGSREARRCRQAEGGDDLVEAVRGMAVERQRPSTSIEHSRVEPRLARAGRRGDRSAPREGGARTRIVEEGPNLARRADGAGRELRRASTGAAPRANRPATPGRRLVGHEPRPPRLVALVVVDVKHLPKRGRNAPRPESEHPQVTRGTPHDVKVVPPDGLAVDVGQVERARARNSGSACRTDRPAQVIDKKTPRAADGRAEVVKDGRWGYLVQADGTTRAA